MLKHLLEELTVGTYAYQLRSQNIIEAWLRRPKIDGAFSFKNSESEKITVRVKEKPPSLQLIHYPLGGVQAGINRICEKILTTREESSSGITTVRNEDLTRETIILTLGDATTNEILEHKLLMPEELVSLFVTAQKFLPKLFIAIHRYLMGIEQRDGQKIPFHLIEQNDAKTWEYLKNTLTSDSV